MSTVNSNVNSFAKNMNKCNVSSCISFEASSFASRCIVENKSVPLTWMFFFSILALCFPSKTLAFESPSLQWPYFQIGLMDVSWNIQQDSSDK